MYTFNSRVRYSETDETGRLSVTGIINYMQDCSTFQSEDAQVGVRYLGKNHKAWLLSSWQIKIDRYPRLGERLIVGTWPYSLKNIRLPELRFKRRNRKRFCEGGFRLVSL